MAESICIGENNRHTPEGITQADLSPDVYAHLQKKICFNFSSNLLFLFRLNNKCVFDIAADCGDHVVVMNTGKIALPGDEWMKRVYFHHTGYAGGASWTLAHELHEKDKTKVITIKKSHDKNNSVLMKCYFCFFRLCGSPSKVQ